MAAGWTKLKPDGGPSGFRSNALRPVYSKSPSDPVSRKVVKGVRPTHALPECVK
jgi:hypothetical protein